MEKENIIDYKNKCIAKMLGWKTNSERSHWKPRGTWNYPTDIHGGYLIDQLKFHSNANWQFEALENIRKQGYWWHIMYNMILIQKPNGRLFEKCCKVEYKNGEKPKEAIFEALFQFSQYLKNKDNDKV